MFLDTVKRLSYYEAQDLYIFWNDNINILNSMSQKFVRLYYLNYFTQEAQLCITKELLVPDLSS